MLAVPTSLHRAGWFAIASVAWIGCTGTIGPAAGPAPQGAAGATGSGGGSTTGIAGTTGVTVDPTVAACAASNNALNAAYDAGARLTRDDFNNTVRNLLGATGTPTPIIRRRRTHRPIPQQRHHSAR